MNQPGPPEPPEPGLRWISKDYVLLRQAVREGRDDYDVLIVGSGYGGSMAAAQLAGREVLADGEPEGGRRRRVRVAVLERGREYAPGMFPSSLQELPSHVRVHRRGRDRIMGRADALLDVRIGPHVSAIVGNGLGGGSLINAGVMEKPRWTKDQEQALPGGLREDLEALFDEVKLALHAGTTLSADHPELAGVPLPKTLALQRVAGKTQGATFRDAAITVETSPHHSDVPRCTLCGDCMTGCNVGAKRSLDTTLLYRAGAAGAEIYTGGSVLKVEPAPGGAGWLVHTVFTDTFLRDRHAVQVVRARRVILAAGTLGSTEILMRSRGQLSLSGRLGSAFSCNGDNMIAVHDGPEPVHATDHEWTPLDRRRVGPTVTGVVQLARDLPGHPGVPSPLIQEFAVPAPLKRLFDETVTTARLLHHLPKWPGRTQGQKELRLDSMAVDPRAMDRTLLVGLIGHDESDGHIVLPEKGPVEGGAGIEWEGAPASPMVDAGYAVAHEALERAAPNADVLPNPAWRPLPRELEGLVEGRGPLLTVHPLGGCRIGHSHLDGVVNHLGQVFRVTDEGSAVYDGLVVLDGSIVPGSVGANPALTIATLAMRACRELARTAWDWTPAPAPGVAPGGASGAPGPQPAPAPVADLLLQGTAASLIVSSDRVLTLPPALLRVGDAFDRWWRSLGGDRSTPPPLPGKLSAPLERKRPEFRASKDCTPPRPQPTQVELMERLAGTAGDKDQFWVELTLCYERAELVELTGHSDRQVKLYEPHSFIRIYDNQGGNARRAMLTLGEHERSARALVCAHLGGTLMISEPWDGLARIPRMFGALRAWWINRGRREAWDWLTGRARGNIPVEALFRSAARAGERRVFRYDLRIGDTKGAANPGAPLLEKGRRLLGRKCLTYRVHGNPWLQLTEMQLHGLPLQGQPVLRVDGRFIARQGVPLLRVIRQENQVVALAEFASFALCWLRILVSIHLWSFRAPDPALVREPRLLPGPVSGLPPPRCTELRLERIGSRIPASVRLTHYPNPGKPPVALIHGYSASGTTFTHESIPQPLARHLWATGRDVWVLDLRTSAGMPTALHPWAFEDAAFADLPRAIAHIRQQTGQRVSVFAHCIGAVMLSMALLTDPADLPRFAHRPHDGPTPRRYAKELGALGDSIERVVLSQKGPMLVYSDHNVLRAYFMRVLRQLVLPEDYQFRVPARGALESDLLDRILSTLPYPPDEFARENPARPWERAPWAGFRHRMDALYARDFKLANIEDRTLHAIEDLFGPLNLDTVAQAIHFVRRNTITDRAGRPFDTSRPVLQARWPKRGTVSIHGCDNGLVDVKTVDAMRSQMAFAGIPYAAFEIPGYGHQDCLIGRDAARDVFPIISANL